ncbi:MAG: hypothetical protein R2849_19440 [Thermomicrobiales bacterium]
MAFGQEDIIQAEPVRLLVMCQPLLEDAGGRSGRVDLHDVEQAELGSRVACALVCHTYPAACRAI